MAKKYIYFFSYQFVAN